jgi:enhancer of yellow 2 transcription factor
LFDRTQDERKKRDEQIRETIMAKLVETGEKDRFMNKDIIIFYCLSYRLKEMLRERLIQCGWRDDLKEYCKDVIRRKGLEKVTIEELVAEITPKGRCKSLMLSPLLIIL